MLETDECVAARGTDAFCAGDKKEHCKPFDASQQTSSDINKDRKRVGKAYL